MTNTEEMYRDKAKELRNEWLSKKQYEGTETLLEYILYASMLYAHNNAIDIAAEGAEVKWDKPAGSHWITDKRDMPVDKSSITKLKLK